MLEKKVEVYRNDRVGLDEYDFNRVETMFWVKRI